MTVDLNTCVKGQKLRSKHGMILTYVGPSGNSFYPHEVRYPQGGYGSRTHDGFTFSNPSKRLEEDNDIVEILPLDNP